MATPRLHHGYSASLPFFGGSNVLYAPFGGNEYPSGLGTYVSATDAQTLAYSAKTMTSAYFYGNGAAAPGGETTPAIGWLRVFDFYIPTDCSPDCVPVGQRVSAKITISSGGYMCGIHNIARSPTTYDYGASYNMPWR